MFSTPESLIPESLIIVNTSPLLYLHQVGHLRLLSQIYGRITVPAAVQQELEVGKSQGIDTPNLRDFDWIQITSVTADTLVPNIIDLGRGEAEVIAIGSKHPGSLLILDDQLGRRIANLYHQKYTGTLGVLIKAKQLGLLDSIEPVIGQLQNQGLWLTESIIQTALRLAGEQIRP